MRLAVWSPLPPSPSGIADYVAESLPALAQRAEPVVIVEDPDACGPTDVPLARAGEEHGCDLDVYHLGNSPAHAYVYRAALETPGVAFMHEWNLHELVLSETVARGRRAAYLREIRREHGADGTFVGGQIARGLGGDLLPALYPLNARVLEASLAVVGLTDYVARRARRRLLARPVLHLQHHLSLPLEPPPDKREARRRLGLEDAAKLVVSPGLATVSKRLDVVMSAVATLCERHRELRLVVAGAAEPSLSLERLARDTGIGAGLVHTGRLSLEDFELYLAAADVVVALRFPSRGEISGALVRALGVGRPALVTAGSPASEEFPEGCVAAVEPGAGEAVALAGLLDELLSRPELCASMGSVARGHMLRHHGLDATSLRLAEFLGGVVARRDALLADVTRRRSPETGLLGYLMDEIRWSAAELSLQGLDLGIEPLLDELGGEAP
jgi:glycosyltransferase involved in cell wall biosynthesis